MSRARDADGAAHNAQRDAVSRTGTPQPAALPEENDGASEPTDRLGELDVVLAPFPARPAGAKPLHPRHACHSLALGFALPSIMMVSPSAMLASEAGSGPAAANPWALGLTEPSEPVDETAELGPRGRGLGGGRRKGAGEGEPGLQVSKRPASRSNTSGAGPGVKTPAQHTRAPTAARR